MRSFQHIIPIGFLVLFLHTTVYCQQIKTIDTQDWLVQKKILASRRHRDRFLFILPVIGANPAAGFIYGLGLTYASIPAGGKWRSSNLSSNASYSTKGLVNLNIKSNLFVLHDRLFLNGDWRFFILSETTYGLGSDLTHPGQVLRYDLGRFHEIASWKITGGFYAGLGIHYDRQFRINDHTADTGGRAVSYHYQYSLRNGFSPQHYTTSGFSLNLMYDGRDNPINTYRGYYVNVNYRINVAGLDSGQNSTMLLADCRAFFPLDGHRLRHILALWGYANIVTSGNVPYLMLPAIGYDQRQKSGRGYAFGRFRGEQLLYAESEYRYPISLHSGILGGVLFVNAVTTSDRNRHIPVMEYIQPAYGAGLCLLIDKFSRTRLQLDCAMGGNKPALYFGIRETF
jgi:outer membrane protein assembly factor BamA